MKKVLPWYRLLPVVVVLGTVTLLSDDALGRHGGAHRWTSGPKTFKTVATNPIAQTRNAQTWATVSGATVTVPILPGRTALINASFFAESQCTGTGAGNWCALRIVIGGVLGEPNAPAGGDGSDYAFDSVSSPVPEQDFWEGHAASRHLCVRNAATLTRFVPVLVQWRVVGVGTLFRLDETSLDVQRSDTCTPIDLTIS